MIQGYTSVQIYKAQARLQIDDERSTAVPGVNSSENTYYEDPEPYYNTQYKILQGRDLIRKVVKKLHLENVPEFNGTAAPPTTPMSVVRDLGKRVIGLVSRLGAGRRRRRRASDETPDESALVSAFIARVGVEPVRTSRLVDVTFQGPDPAFAAPAANALVDEYVQQNVDLKTQATKNMIEWLDNELATQQKKVQDSERQLAEYRDKKNAMSLDDKNNIVAQRLNHLNDQLMLAKNDRIQKESLYNQVKSMSAQRVAGRDPGGGAESAGAVAQGQDRRAHGEEGAALGEIRPRASADDGGERPARGRAEPAPDRDQQGADVDQERIRHGAAPRSRRSRRTSRPRKCDSQDLARKSVDYNVMEREAKSNRTVYEALLQREKELSVASNSHANNVRIIDRAEVPKAPITPTGRRTWLLAFAVGLVLAVGVAFGLDYMNDTIKTPEDVTRHLKLPFLGLVPSVRGDKHPVLASSHVPHDFGESFRALRTSIVAEVPGRRHEDHGRHERAAARRQDDDGGQHRDGAGLRRLARAADRRRHAASRACTARCGSPTSAASRRCSSARRACATSFSGPSIRTCSRSPPARRRRIRRSCSPRSA